MRTRTIALLVALLLLLPCALPACAAPAADPAAQVEAHISAILRGQMAQSGADSLQAWIDTALTDSVGLGGEWYVLGLGQLPGFEGDLSAPLAALEAALAQSSLSLATRQKLALCLLAAGGDAASAASAAEAAGQQGIMTRIFGLHLLNNGCTAGAQTRESAVGQLLSMQLEDGGWALMGKNADVDVTAMALQALAPHTGDPAVQEAVQRALAVLSARQQPDGGFIGMGVANPESAAQVLAALCGLGIDPAQDERFVKNGCTIMDSFAPYALPEGGWSHTAGGGSNATATVQVFLACTAYSRFLQGLPGLYLIGGAGAAGVSGGVGDNAPDAAEVPGAAAPAAAADGGSADPTANAPDPAAAAADTAPAASPAAPSLGIIGGADGPTMILVSGNWKLWVTVGIAGAALLWCIGLLIRGKRSPRSYLAALLVAVAAILLLWVTDVQSPESYYRQQELPGGEPIGTVTLEIRCDTLPAGTENVPADGQLLPPTRCPIQAGDTVYDVLIRAAREHHIQLDARGGPGMVYLAGIQYLYEQAHGELSGWMYFVNGVSASQSCDCLPLADGDSILWAYTCEMGADLN